ncbi:hypothetical protein OPV22_000559 [Ensete ventricosum]|uniref:Uncharacterized protein n=1 Tax=Ensete ventricosum TaxID=4639 RepID=A0AAV8QB35_ENSVE|nr:hypothetical protein OPV22_000559 [Ensete ventricosum]
MDNDPPRLDRPTPVRCCDRATVTDSDVIGSHSESDKLASPKAMMMFLPESDTLCRIPIRYYVEALRYIYIAETELAGSSGEGKIAK